ncbi:MAG: DAK2 domain-containing protein, partial [bacterium]
MTRTPTKTLDGPQIRDIFSAGAGWLEQNKEAVDKVNVFPVPDGDTGKNMSATMAAVIKAAQNCRESGAGPMLAAMQRAALMESCGNSGALLWRIISGIAAAAEGRDELAAEILVAGLEEGAARAYRAVQTPAEGTILTVARDVAEVVRRHVDAGEKDIVELLRVAVQESKESVERTTDIHPELRAAGVVDAGGLGFSIILEGMLAHLTGERPEPVAVQAAATVGQGWLAETAERHQAG